MKNNTDIAQMNPEDVLSDTIQSQDDRPSMMTFIPVVQSQQKPRELMTVGKQKL